MADKKQSAKLQKWKKSKVKKLNKWVKVKKNTDLVTTWRGKGWIAEVVQNEDGGGWAVEMRREGDEHPVYVAPWTMGRNKIDPKPLSQNAFNTWVKSASEFLMRSQHQSRTADRSSVTITMDDGESLKIIFDIERGDYQSAGVLVAENVFGEEVARTETHSSFVLNVDTAEEWVRSDFAAPPLPEPGGEPLQEHDEYPDAIHEDGLEYEEEYSVEYVEYDGVESYEEPVFEYD